MIERDETRQRIIEATTRLLDAEGREGVTTRAVSAAAGVQPPAIYRFFIDMNGLLDAVAAIAFEEYFKSKATQSMTGDPVEDLRAAWDLHIEYGLARPAHYLLMHAQPDHRRPNPAAAEGTRRLGAIVERVAAAGQLTVSVATAVAMIHAAGSGLVLTLIGTPPADRDPDLSPRLREATIGAITGQAAPEPPGYASRAAGLKAALGDADGPLTNGERALLGELLDRLADDAAPGERTTPADS